MGENMKIEVAEHHGSNDGTTDNADIIVWSADRSRLMSTFSSRCRKSQHIVLAEERPANGRTTFVNTCYHHLDLVTLRQKVDDMVSGKLQFSAAPRAEALLRDLRGGGWPAWAHGDTERCRSRDDSSAIVEHQGGERLAHLHDISNKAPSTPT